MLMVDTTLPWTAEWLINYEIWRATGLWYGGGQYPLVRAPKREPERSDVEQSRSPSAAKM
jgi:hypothetical protein